MPPISHRHALIAGLTTQPQASEIVFRLDFAGAGNLRHGEQREMGAPLQTPLRLTPFI